MYSLTEGKSIAGPGVTVAVTLDVYLNAGSNSTNVFHINAMAIWLR